MRITLHTQAKISLAPVHTLGVPTLDALACWRPLPVTLPWPFYKRSQKQVNKKYNNGSNSCSSSVIIWARVVLKGLLLVTDVSTTSVEVIIRVKWRVVCQSRTHGLVSVYTHLTNAGREGQEEGGGGHLQTRAAHNRLIPYLRGLAIPLLVSCQSSAASVGQICRLHLTSHDSVYSSHLCLQELQHPQCEQLRPFSVLCPVLKEGYNTWSTMILSLNHSTYFTSISLGEFNLNLSRRHVK